jgi:hypothetical protein
MEVWNMTLMMMITNIGNNLKLLPYGDYTGYILSKEGDAEKTAKGKDSWLFISNAPKAIYLFVRGIKELEYTE